MQTLGIAPRQRLFWRFGEGGGLLLNRARSVYIDGLFRRVCDDSRAEGFILLLTRMTYSGGDIVKNCKLCNYSKLCNDLPGVCVVVPHIAVAVVTVALGYLFVTQELM
jgi:hypothetical protein